MKRKVLLLASSFALLAFASIAQTQQPCRKIKAEANVVDGTNIRIDLKGMSDLDVQVSVFGPRGKAELDCRTPEISNTSKGKYLIIFSGRTEESNFCVKEIKLTIQ